VVDPSRADLKKEWRDEGIRVINADTRVEEGIEAVRNAMAPVIGRPKFLVNRICKDWRREVQSYSEKNGKPIDKDNHAMDETRYHDMRYIAKRQKVRLRRLN